MMKNLILALIVAASCAGCVTDDGASSDSGHAGTVGINTREYPYIGYFASMRRSIEEQWSYPPSAVKEGHQGSVELEFKIQKNGRVKDIKVRKSSGHPELDDGIVKSIEAAEPFLPLPTEFKKDVMTVTGTFRYSLDAYKAAQQGPPPKKRHGPRRGLIITEPAD